MKISIIHPSFGRPELAVKTCDKWIHAAKGSVEYILCLSIDDPKYEVYMTLFLGLPVKVITIKPANMVKQMNFAAKESSGDLIVCISDDFDCPKNWDKLLTDKLKDKKDFVVQIDDGIKAQGVNTKGIISLPIMDRTFYNRLGYIYNPEYNHFYGDEELYRVGKVLGKKIELPILFEHIHHIAGKAKKDHVNIKNSKHYAGDKGTFLIREQNGFDLVTLSLLIPSLKNRAQKLNVLLNTLQSQIEKLRAENVVQLIKFTDNGQRTIGEKRNRLVEAAKGDYVAFIDDDDSVPDNYIQLLLSAIQDKPDCCSLNGILTTNKRQRVFKHSISYKGWYEREGVLFRYPNHLNAIKKEIALQIGFPNKSHGEDFEYSSRLQESGLLKTEAIINEPLYFYNK